MSTEKLTLITMENHLPSKIYYTFNAVINFLKVTDAPI